jgi:hypothetical protein
MTTSESVPRTSITVTLNEGPVTHRIGTFRVPDEITQKGREAIFDWLVHHLKEDLCNQKK